MCARDSSERELISVGFVSLGCAKNLVDSQIMAGVLRDQGMELSDSPEEADVLLVNTCSFIEDAREESWEAIRKACETKDSGWCRAVIVAGCLPQRYRSAVFKEYPLVDAIVGVDDLADIGAVIERVLAGKKRIVALTRSPVRVFNPSAGAPVFSSGAYAYLKIAEGCNHQCSFCAIPGIRGRFRSRKTDDILAEAEKLLSMGFRELTLVAQDTTRYGSDLGQGDGLPDLLEKLDSFGGEYWVRFLYAFPDRITDRLLDVIATSRHVCRYFDVPIQHSHPDILKAMRRGATALSVQSLAHRIRERLPDAVVRTTCLVGFPGETEKHFNQLRQHMLEACYDNLGVFAFSREDGTRAASMRGVVRNIVAQRRRQQLLGDQQKIVRKTLRKLIGKEDRVLLERKLSDGVWAGRTARQAPEVDGLTMVSNVPASGFGVGDFVNCVYTRQIGYDLVADIIR